MKNNLVLMLYILQNKNCDWTIKQNKYSNLHLQDHDSIAKMYVNAVVIESHYSNIHYELPSDGSACFYVSFLIKHGVFHHHKQISQMKYLYIAIFNPLPTGSKV